MSLTSSSRPFRARLAVWLGFVAVFAALLAPGSMLAEEVRTGKIGGICSVKVSAGANNPDAADQGDAASLGAHCDLCGSLGLGLPPVNAATSEAARPTTAMAVVFDDAVRSAAPPGLPFSRGPPLL